MVSQVNVINLQFNLYVSKGYSYFKSHANTISYIWLIDMANYVHNYFPPYILYMQI
jgi:hypothetical protein